MYTNIISSNEVKCPLCNKTYVFLTTHFNRTHNIKDKQYLQFQKEHPEILFISEELSKKTAAPGIKYWKDEVWKKKQLDIRKTEDYVKKRSEGMKRVASTGIFVECGKLGIAKRKQNLSKFIEISSKTLRATNERLKREEPEKYHNDKVKAGKQCHIDHPELSREIGLKVHQKYPTLHRDVMIAVNKKYPNQAKEASKKSKVMHPDKWKHGLNYLNNNSPFKFMNIGWHNSPLQRDITKLLFEKLSIVPIKGENCQIYYKGGEHDFNILGFIYEPHSLDCMGRTETKEQYYQRKRDTMNRNGFKEHELVVTTTFEEAKQLIEWLHQKIGPLSPTLYEEVEKSMVKIV